MLKVIAPLFEAMTFQRGIQYRKVTNLFFTAVLFIISRDCVLDGFDSVLSAAALFDRGFLALEVLVDREEMPHFVEDMRRQLVDIGVHIVRRIGKRYRDDFLVVSAAVDHGNHTDRISATQRKRIERFRAKQQHVQRIAVVAERSRDKTVVCGVMRGSVQNSVENNVTRRFVEFVFFLTALGDLDNAHEIFGRDSFGRDIVPDI